MSSADPFNPPVAIAGGHQTAGFDCGEEALNVYLQRFALTNHQAGYARTFVSCDPDQRILGYYSLSAGQILREEASERLSRGSARHPIPVTILTRLAVDQTVQRRGLGAGLLHDAIRRILAVAESVGIRAILVHAKQQKTTDFYRNSGFEPLPGNPLALYLLLKDARRTLG